MFQHIPKLVNRYLMPPNLIVLHYTVNPAVAPPERPLVWYNNVKTEDGAMNNQMTTMVEANKKSAQELAKLDEKVKGKLSFTYTLL